MKTQIETAVILLAGRGSRLEELTDNKPKCLVKVNKTPILHRILDELAHLEIKKIILVVGYLHKQIINYVGNEWKNIKIQYVINKNWFRTNNVVSLYMALDKIKSNFLLLEGDIIVSERALKNFSKTNLLALDRYRNYMDGTVVKLNKNNSVEKFYLKNSPDRPKNLESYYKTVNIYSFAKKDFFEYIKPRLEKIINSKQTNSYYELAIARAIDADEITLKSVNFKHLKWAEIDDQKDLQYAEKLFDDKLDI